MVILSPPPLPLSAPATSEELLERLHLLQSGNERKRQSSFASIRKCPRADLREAWKKARRLVPEHGGKLDCFNRVEVILEKPVECERAIVTVITSGGNWEHWLFLLLKSLEKFGEVGDAKFVVFCVGECFETVKSWNFPFVVSVPCILRERASTAVKGVVYSCAQWVNAPSIIALESDMLCLTALEPLWQLIEEGPEGALGGVPPQFFAELEPVSHVLERLGAASSQLDFLFGDGADVPMHWNGGLLAGKRAAWQQLEERLEAYAPFSLMWLEGGFPLWFAEEVLINRAAHLGKDAFDLPRGWNAQVGEPEREKDLHNENGRYFIVQQGEAKEEAKILHFLAGGRAHMDTVAKELGLL